MGVQDLVPDEKQTDWDSVMCPNCQQQEQLKLVSHSMKNIICKNENCRVMQFLVREELR